MIMNEQMYRQALKHLDMCYMLVDNTYPEFSRANYKDLPIFARRLALGERSAELYEAIMNWSL